MKKGLAFILTALLCVGMLAFAAAESTEAATEAAETQTTTQQVDAARTVDIPIFTENTVLDLPRNETSFWFSVPEGTVLSGDGIVRLHMEVSDTLINERSSITLSMNGEQLTTIHILDIVNDMDGWWEVDVPAEVIRTDGKLNELTFSTVQRSILGDCNDIDNPSNWVKLMEDSHLRLTVAAEGAIKLSNVLTYMYDTLENTGALASEFIIANNATNDELSAMLQASVSVGAHYPYRRDLDIAVSASESGSQPNKVYVGIRETGVFSVPSLGAGEGYLACERKDGINRLLITGADAQGLDRAARVLGNDLLLGYLQEQTVSVDQDVTIDSDSIAWQEDGYYTLEDFGYDDINLAGAFHQQTYLTLEQPGGMISGSLSYIEIKFRHSEALVSDDSLITVYINDSAIDSAKLSASNAKEGSLKVTIPKDALDNETISVRIDVYNYLGKVDCSKDFYDTAWTVIEKESGVYFEPGTEPITPSLSNFPTLSCDTCVVIGDSDSRALAAAVAIRGGQKNGQTTWLTDDLDALYNPSSDADYIILSDNESLSLPQSVEDALAVVPVSNRSFEIKEETGLISAILADKLVVQVIRAPWSDSRRVYVITYPSGGEDMALALISQYDVTSSFGDQIAMVSEQGNVSTVDTVETITQSDAPLTWERLAYLVKTKTGYSIWMVIILIIVLLIIIFLIIRASINRSRFKRAADGVKGQNGNPTDMADIDSDSSKGRYRNKE